MIYPSLEALAKGLNSFIFKKWGSTINGTNDIVILGNIANINDEKNDLQNKIVLTLLKVEEESSLKNGSLYTKKSDLKVAKHYPPINLNLYILISVTKKTYTEALQLLSDTIMFFQSHKVFEEESEGNSYRIVTEFHDINFQEVFEMWSNLGSKQFPFVIYKSRLLKFLDIQESKEVPVIEEVHLISEDGPDVN